MRRSVARAVMRAVMPMRSQQLMLRVSACVASVTSKRSRAHGEPLASSLASPSPPPSPALRRSMVTVGIVGAGICGLGAAQTLLGDKRIGSVTVFEATKRVGGRARTDTTTLGGGFAFEQGAVALENPHMHNLDELATQLECNVVEEDSDGDTVWRDEHGQDHAAFPSELEKQDKDPPGPASMNAKIESDYDDRKSKPTLAVARDTWAQSALLSSDQHWALAWSHLGSIREAAEPTQYLAADRARQEMHEEKANDQLKERGAVKVREGLSTMMDRFAASLTKQYGKRFTLALGEPVVAVHAVQRAQGLGPGVELKWIKGATHPTQRFDRAIVTVPLPLLGDLDWDGQLPASHMRALQWLALGSYKKVAIGVPKGAFLHELVPGRKYYTVDREFRGVWTYYRTKTHPEVILFTATGDFAHWLDTNENQLAVYARIRALVHARHGVDLPNPPGPHLVVTNWTHDEWTRGAFSYTRAPPPDSGVEENDTQVLDARETLQVPFGHGNTVQIAGEHTDMMAYGTLHGAYMQGQRAAKAILQALH